MVKNVYALDENNKPIVIYRKNNEETPFDKKHFLKFLETLKIFAKSMDENFKDVVIGDNKYFYTKDEMNEKSFIMETRSNMSNKEAHPLLEKVRSAYINEFIGEMTMGQKEYEAAKQRFIERLSKLFKSYDLTITDFLKQL